MKRNSLDFIPGIAIYLLLSVLVGVSVAMRALPGQFDEWLGSSSSPREALIYFSLLISSLILILTRFGIEINLFNMAKGENFKRYAAGLPLWFLFISLAGALFQFYRFYPACKTPESVFFEIIGKEKTYLPFDVIELPAGASFTITARSSDNEVLLSCLSWELVGPAFETLGQKDGCQVNIQVNDQPGVGYITLLASQNFCSQATLFSIEVNIVEP
jgi:hypothetical protein